MSRILEWLTQWQDVPFISVPEVIYVTHPYSAQQLWASCSICRGHYTHGKSPLQLQYTIRAAPSNTWHRTFAVSCPISFSSPKMVSVNVCASFLSVVAMANRRCVTPYDSMEKNCTAECIYEVILHVGTDIDCIMLDCFHNIRCLLNCTVK